MRSFSEYNPVAIFIYFFSVTGVAMFNTHPVLTALSLVGGIICLLTYDKKRRYKEHIGFFILFLILAAANPLVSHNGVTVLFVLNNNPVTLEALLYGINSAAIIIGVLYWFRTFTHIMTSDKLLYITGALSPKLSLVLSMALRYVPMFREQTEKVRNAQKGMGLFKDDNIIDDIRSNMRIYSILITWALENGITTADSMEARGFGVGKRSCYSNFSFRTSDVLFILTDLSLLTATVIGMISGRFNYVFYPKINSADMGAVGTVGAIAYSVLIFLPFIIEMAVNIRWKYLKSKI